MKLRLIHEGVSIDDATGNLKFDFQNDNPEDVLQFFQGSPLVHSIGNDIYAGFVFSEMSPDMESHEKEKTAISLAKAYKAFAREYKALVDKHGQKSISGIEILNPKSFTNDLRKSNSYASLRKMLGASAVDGVIKASGTNSIAVGGGIKTLIDQQYDWSLVQQYVQGKLKMPTRGKTNAGTKRSDLQSEFDRVKNRIIRALNTGVTGGDEEIEHFVYFAAERLANFDGFGFTPDLLIRPRSNSALLRDFVDMVSQEMGVPAVEGLVKARSNVTYTQDGNTIILVDSSGQVGPDLDDDNWIGRGTTLAKAANKIVGGTFKITHLYPPNRDNLQGLFKPLPALNDALRANTNANVLMIDDSIFSGTTQREMMGQLQSLPIGNVASYAVVKA